MEVFISWSGDQSRSVAETLKKYLPHILPGISPFVSTQDIDAGDRWEARLSEELSKTNSAVLCVTRENQTSPWLNYEAGSLAKIVGVSKVIPYTIDFSPREMAKGPLTRFQAVQNDKNGTWNLINSLRQSMPRRDEEAFILDNFDMWWPPLQDRMASTKNSEKGLNEKEKTEVLNELLLEIRQDVRRLVNRSLSYENLSADDAIAILESSFRDSLTTLPNRKAFTDRASELVANNVPFVVACLDLDKLRPINDEFGHARGDEVIRGVADVIAKRLSSADFVARVGGDEFAVIYRGLSSAAVGEVMSTFIQVLPRDLTAMGLPAITCSCGVSGDLLNNLERKLRDVDHAVYEAKAKGGGCVVLRGQDS